MVTETLFGRMQTVMPGGQREFTGIIRRFISIVAVIMSLYHIAWITGFLMRLNIHILSMQHMSISLGFILFLTFLLYPASGKPKPEVPWYDILFSILGLVSCWYFAVFFNSHIILAYATYKPSIVDYLLFIILLLLLLESGRRTTGLGLSLFTIGFLFYMVFADYFPGILHSRSFGLDFTVVHMYMGEDGVWSIAMEVCATVIAAFLVFAGFVLASGAANAFLTLALRVGGRWRGGPAKAAIVGSALFGTISGSSTANAASVGTITIPLMKSIGYRPVFAAAVEAVASNGGILMPPVMGVVAFIMAQFTGIPYIKICLYAALPAILYYLGLFIQVDLEAARYGLKGLPKEKLPLWNKTIEEVWPYLLPIASLLFFMIVMGFEPEMAAIYSVLILIVVSWFRKERGKLEAIIVCT